MAPNGSTGLNKSTKKSKSFYNLKQSMFVSIKRRYYTCRFKFKAVQNFSSQSSYTMSNKFFLSLLRLIHFQKIAHPKNYQIATVRPKESKFLAVANTFIYVCWQVSKNHTKVDINCLAMPFVCMRVRFCFCFDEKCNNRATHFCEISHERQTKLALKLIFY